MANIFYPDIGHADVDDVACFLVIQGPKTET